MTDVYDLIIIGGGSAGLSAGIYAGRARLKTLIVEKEKPGGQAANTEEVANYPAIRQTTGPSLMNDMHLHALDFGVDFTTIEIERVDFSKTIKELYTSNGKLEALSVIIATGASPRKAGFAGEAEFIGKGIGYCSTCDGEFFSGLDIFVIGGGYAAAEEAIYLTRFGKSLTVIVRGDEFTCAKSIIEKVISHPKITVKFNTELMEVSGEEVLNKAIFRNTKTGEIFTYTASESDKTFGVFVFVGYEPANEVIKGHVELNDRGYIITDENMQTNVEGVYAAGDIRPKSLRQIVTAVSDGAIAATTAEKYVAELKEKLGLKDESEKPKPSKTENQTTEEIGIQKASSLDGNMQSQIKSIFQKLNKNITIVTVTDHQNFKTLELKAFAEDISKLSPYIRAISYTKNENTELEQSINCDKLPIAAFLDSEGKYTGIKFHGVPGGHEINSFVAAIYNLAGYGQKLTPELLSRIKGIGKNVNIKVCVTLSCHFCPDVVIACQKIASENENIEAEMIDVTLFPDIRNEYKIMSVPAVIVNNENILFGAKKIEQLVDYIEKSI